MKKLVIILLLGIYAITAFGDAVYSYDCCKTTSGRNAAAYLNGAINEDGCANQHQSAAFNNHHIVPHTVHFLVRNFTIIQQHTAVSTFELEAITKQQYLNSRKTQVSSGYYSTPVHVLNCVYRI